MAKILKILTFSVLTISLIQALPVSRYSPPRINPAVALGAGLSANNRSQSNGDSGFATLYTILILLSIPLGLFLLFWICIGCYICTATLLEKILDICRRHDTNCCFCNRNKETNELENQDKQLSIRVSQLSKFTNGEQQQPKAPNKNLPQKVAILNDGSCSVTNRNSTVEYGGTKVPWCTNGMPYMFLNLNKY